MNGNRKTLRIMLICTALPCFFILAHPVYGQFRGDGKEFVQSLTERLKLTDEQTVKVQTIFDSTRVQGLRDRETYQGDHEALLTVARARVEKMNASIQAILTDEQKAEFSKLNEERRATMQNRPHDRMKRMD